MDTNHRRSHLDCQPANSRLRAAQVCIDVETLYDETYTFTGTAQLRAWAWIR